jgi:Flp pilus assembly pilin Flp
LIFDSFKQSTNREVKMAIRKRKQKGQAIMEYVIIIVVVALAALVVIGAFSDRIRALFAGATNTLGGEADVSTKSTAVMKEMQEEGIELDE